MPNSRCGDEERQREWKKQSDLKTVYGFKEFKSVVTEFRLAYRTLSQCGVWLKEREPVISLGDGL